MGSIYYEHIFLSSEALKKLIEEGQYDKANEELTNMKNLIRKLDKKSFALLDEEQVSYLQKLAEWLIDSEGEMQERRDKLVDVIAPLNQASNVNKRKQYQR